MSADHHGQKDAETTRQSVRLQRDREILELRATGASLGEIGEAAGLSRERIRQIVQRYDGVNASAALRARRARDDRTVVERSSEILDAWRAGRQLGDIARELATSTPAVRRVVDTLATPADRALRARALRGQCSSERYSDDDLIRGVREVAERLAHAPSASEYAELAGELRLASLATVYKRAGSWRKAIAAAGLEPRTINRQYLRQWDDNACWQAARRAMSEIGPQPTYSSYERLAASRPDLPSGATLRSRLGRWGDIAVALTNERALSTTDE